MEKKQFIFTGSVGPEEPKWDEASLIKPREKKRGEFEIALLIFRQWWGRNREYFLNKSIPYNEAYSKYLSETGSSPKISRNSFLKSWTIMCQKAGYTFSTNRIRNKTIYNTYENEFLGK